jgi:heme exporter protein A
VGAGLIKSFRARRYIEPEYWKNARNSDVFRDATDPPTKAGRDKRRNLMRLVGENLVCRRGGRTVFSGLNFSVSSGESLLVVGRNGAGKSSLLRMIAGLICNYDGRLEITGGEGELTLAEQAHYLGHLDALKPSLSVSENLRFWAEYLGSTNADIGSALETVDLTRLASLPAGYLSAGQRRRLSIARLVAVQRPVWLLDEPTSALDVQSQERLAGLMRQHVAGGGMILAATHGPIGLDGSRELRVGPE